jgi:hypothetical protein
VAGRGGDTALCGSPYATKHSMKANLQKRLVLAALMLVVIAIPVWIWHFGPLLIVRHIQRHDRKTVNWFCRLGVSPNRDAWLKGGVFHCAIAAGDSNIVLMLISRGADVNRIDAYGATPLHVATRAGDLDMIKLLVDAGADPSKADRDGATPLDWAKEENLQDVQR